MALNIKNREVDELASELADLTGLNKTQIIRQALQEYKVNISYKIASVGKEAKLKDFLEKEIWKKIPKSLLGKKISKKEVEEILGMGDDGL